MSKDSRHNQLKALSRDRTMAQRHARVHDMVTEVLFRVDRYGYRHVLESLRAQYSPEGTGETQVIALAAELAWRIRGCTYLETEILNGGRAETSWGLPETGKDSLIAKLYSYEIHLSREFSRYVRIIEMSARNRAAARSRMAASLEKLKPCTSVIQ